MIKDGALRLSGVTSNFNHMKNINIDVSDLPEELAMDLEKQARELVEKAREELPISFQDRIDRALYDLPEELGEITDSEALVKLIKKELQAHFDKLRTIDQIVNKAEDAISWDEEEFDRNELESDISHALNQFFL